VNFAPTTDLWVLEIQIRHPERQIGTFYEDLLLDQGFNVIEFYGQRRVGVDGTTHALLRSRLANAMS
jgi:hypothetical protein